MGYGANLSVKELKKIANDIIDEEAKKNNLKIKAYPVTLIEYYTDFVFKDNFSLQRFNDFSGYPFNSVGFHDEGNIIIFVNKIKREKVVKGNSSLLLLALLSTVYHEIRHNLQEKYDKSSYEDFLVSLERLLRSGKVREFNYEKNHDEFSYEIGADLYGIRRTKEYLINKYPEIYDEVKRNIENIEKYCLINYYMYDASYIYDLVIPIIRDKLRNGNYSKNYIVLNNDGSFSSVREMFDNSQFNDLDIRIRAAIMSSRTYLKELDYGELSYDELEYLNEMVNYTNTIYDNQLNYLEKIAGKGVISDNEILSKKQGVIKRKKELEFYIDKIGLYMSIAKIIDEKKNRS